MASDVDNPLLGPQRRGGGVRPPEGGHGGGCRRGSTPRWPAGPPRWRPRAASARCPTATPPRTSGGGAAGGVGFAALAALRAPSPAGDRRPARDHRVARPRCRGARLVITGEGSLDAQTLRGKAPAGVAAAAAAAGVPVVAVAGRCLLTADELARSGHPGRLRPERPGARRAPVHGRGRAAPAPAGRCARPGLAAGEDDLMTAAPLFVNGEGMRGGAVHAKSRATRSWGMPGRRPGTGSTPSATASPRSGRSARVAFVPGELYEVPLAVIREGSCRTSRPSWSWGDRARRRRGGPRRRAAAVRPRGAGPGGHLRRRRLAGLPRGTWRTGGGPGGGFVRQLDLVVRGPRVVTSAGEVPRSLGVTDGRIVAIEPGTRISPATGWSSSATTSYCCPASSTPTSTSTSRGARSGRASPPPPVPAAAGGVTTIIDMPLNCIPPTVDLPALEIKRKVAEGQTYVDLGFWGGAIPGNLDALRGLHDAGVFGFKCFLLALRRPRVPPPRAGRARGVHGRSASFGAMLIVHAENDVAIQRAPSAHGESYSTSWRHVPAGPRTSPSPRSSRPPGGPVLGSTSCTCPARTRSP